MWLAVQSRKPPWNHPQVMFLAFRRSPIFFPVIWTVSRVEHLSKAGCASLIREPEATSKARTTAGRFFGTAPVVSPEIKLMAPGDEGPNVVEKELSLMAKCWA